MNFLQFMELHWIALLPWAYMGVTALFITMPIPGTKLDGQALYRWVYDSVHQFANLKNQRPTLPAETPDSTKPQ